MLEHQRKKFILYLLGLIVLFIFFLPNKTTTQAATDTCTPEGDATEASVTPTVPTTAELFTLQIPIPGFPGFSPEPIQEEGGEHFFYFPWIGQYIGAMYQYILGIVGILATVVLVWAGVVWLTAGGNAEKIKIAKEYIAGALIGLVLAFGSYLILYTLNPDLVKFKAMKLKVVERIDIAFVDLNSTEANTWAEDFVAPPAFSDCPITDLPPNEDPLRRINNPRTEAFISQIRTMVTGTTREKVMQIADAAVKCGIFMGSCGNTADTIFWIAGVPGLSRSCTKGKMDGHAGRTIREINGEQQQYLCKINCGARPGPIMADPSGKYLCAGEKIPGRADWPCFFNSMDQKAKTRWLLPIVYDHFKNEIPGWPDSWIDGEGGKPGLEPGDKVIFFNANDDPPGNHAVIFMGWASEGRAKIIGGGSGQLIKESSVCLKTTCQSPTYSNPFPIMRFSKPD